MMLPGNGSPVNGSLMAVLISEKFPCRISAVGTELNGLGKGVRPDAFVRAHEERLVVAVIEFRQDDGPVRLEWRTGYVCAGILRKGAVLEIPARVKRSRPG